MVRPPPHDDGERTHVTTYACCVILSAPITCRHVHRTRAYRHLELVAMLRECAECDHLHLRPDASPMCRHSCVPCRDVHVCFVSHSSTQRWWWSVSAGKVVLRTVLVPCHCIMRLILVRAMWCTGVDMSSGSYHCRSDQSVPSLAQWVAGELDDKGSVILAADPFDDCAMCHLVLNGMPKCIACSHGTKHTCWCCQFPVNHMQYAWSIALSIC